MRLMVVSLSLALLAGRRARRTPPQPERDPAPVDRARDPGFALQWVTGPGSTVPLLCLYLSFVLLTIFSLKNIRVVGFPIILVGIAMNFLVIGLNQGMPVARQALVSSGQADTLDDLISQPVSEASPRERRRPRRLPR